MQKIKENNEAFNRLLQIIEEQIKIIKEAQSKVALSAETYAETIRKNEDVENNNNS
jgi:hypothetical protein